MTFEVFLLKRQVLFGEETKRCLVGIGGVRKSVVRPLSIQEFVGKQRFVTVDYWLPGND